VQILTPKIFKDRLTTTDEDGQRVRVIPMTVRGRFQKIKHWVHLAMMGIFLALPWIKIGGYPALQLDIPQRRFFILGHLFLPQDVPGLFFILAAFVMTLLFLTAIFGRVWCGWACPQTVFIEGIFRRIERWIEGDHVKQRLLDKRPWDFFKLRIKGFKWVAFTGAALVLTHSFLAYFVGAENVLQMIMRSPAENPGSFAVVMVSTAVILFDFGWFREQFCLIACPYGRFQSALMDDKSITVSYDHTRNDCIQCLKCVKVCPTGIDIRNGFQMECIGCTACIDVCDEVMVKVKQPTGLIRYASEAQIRGENHRILRPRVFVYAALLVLMVSGLFYRVATQETFQTEVIRAVDTPYQIVRSGAGDEQVLNHFKVNWYNLSPEGAQVRLKLSDADLAKGFELIQNQQEHTVNTAKTVRHQFFVKFPKALLNNTDKANAAADQVVVEAYWQTAKGEFVTQKQIKLLGPNASI